MANDQILGSFRIVSGAARQVWGRMAGDELMAASGRIEQLAGEVALACVRARLRGLSRELPRTGV